jgi:membrane fusion protein (multidrug efflux system)
VAKPGFRADCNPRGCPHLHSRSWIGVQREVRHGPIANIAVSNTQSEPARSAGQKRIMKNARLHKTLHLLGSLAVLTGLASCESEGHTEETEGQFLVTSPLKKDTETTQEYVCQIRSIQHIELRALERGYLEGIYVDEGQTVKTGQRMFQIMPRVYQAELQTSKAEAEFAEIEYKNTKLLADQNVVSPNELALAKAKLDKAKAQMELANVHRGLTEIKAPFDGIMDRLHVRQGSLVEEGELLTELADNSKMWVYFNVAEAEYLDYKSSADNGTKPSVKLLMANDKLFDQDGVIETIEADFNNETGTIAFRATFPNPKGILRHGETGKVLMTTPLKNAMLIPQKASFEVLDKKYVFVVDEDGTIKSRKITIAAELPHVYVVESGLEPTDKILLEGLRKVNDGDHIATKFQDPKEVMSHLDLPAE